VGAVRQTMSYTYVEPNTPVISGHYPYVSWSTPSLILSTFFASVGETSDLFDLTIQRLTHYLSFDPRG